MRFRNAISLTVDNFSSVYKMLLYQIITTIIFGSFTFVILRLGLNSVIQSGEVATLKDLLGAFIRALFTGEVETLHAFQPEFQEAFKAFLTLLGNKIGSIVGSVIGVSIMYLLSRFANGLSVFAVANILNDRMSIFARTRFSHSFFKNIGTAALYQVIYVPLSFAYDVLSLLACWFFFFYAPSFLPSWGFVTVLLAISLTLTAYIGLQAIKMTFVSAWMPSIVAGKRKVGTGLKESVTARKSFGRRFSSYLVAIYTIVALNIVFGLVTFGSALLLTVPISFLFLLALQFVHYYEDSGHKYFISFNQIAGGEDTPDGMEL